MDCACSGAGARASAYPAPWRFKYLSDERTERGTTVLVAGFDCYVVCNVFVVIVRSAIDGKWVVTSCVSLMDGSYQSYIGWRCGIICSGGSPSWIEYGRWRIIMCNGAQHPHAGLSLAPSFLALRAIMGGAPSVMVFRWLAGVAHYAGELAGGYCRVVGWPGFVQ